MWRCHLPQVAQQAAGGADVGPAALVPAGARPLAAVPALALDQNHVAVFLGPPQPLGQNAAVALIHKQQHARGPAAGQVGQQLVDRVSLLRVGLGGQRDGGVLVYSQ